jgi:tagatose 1,6-diphosphate aldolase GatY/KbaY
LSIVNAKELLLDATRRKFAVGAFNITNVVQLEAVIEAHIEKKAPLILQTSVSPSKFIGPDVIVSIYKTLAEKAPIPICLHLDHCEDGGYCKICAKTGYTNIMIDASKHPFEENINISKDVVSFCHANSGASVEGELGTVSGVEDQIKVAEDESQLCNPDQALEFVERTGVDLLAPAIGTAHGIYTTKNPKVDFERFKKIFEVINGNNLRTPLVIHGGTGLPRDYVEKLISYGGSKINVSTELKHVLIDSTWQYLSTHREEFDPGKIDKAVKEAIKQSVFAWIEIIGSAGRV